MATERLTIVVDERGARVVAGNIRKVGTAGKEAAGGVNFLSGALRALATGAGVAGVLRLADNYAILQNRLRIVTNTSQELAAVNRELFGLAQRTRSDLLGTGELYARVARSSDELGLSQRQVLELTESVNQAIQVSGATAQEASAGVIQFAQGLASGALRGDELRSVMEQMPRLARAIADGMGISIGELRKFGEAGRLTAEQIIRAIQSQAGTLREEFANITPTIGQAWTTLINSLTAFIGELSVATGAGKALSDAIIFLADNVEILAVVLAAAGAALLVAFGPVALSAVLALNAALLANPILLVAAGIAAATAALILFGNEIKVSSDGLVGLRDWAQAAFEIASEKASEAAVTIRDEVTAAVDVLIERFKTFDVDIATIWDNVILGVRRMVNLWVGLWVGMFNSLVGLAKAFIMKLEDLFSEGPGFDVEFTRIISDAMTDALSRDYIQEVSDFLSDLNQVVMGRAREIAALRSTELGGAPDLGAGGVLGKQQDFFEGFKKGLNEVAASVSDFSKNSERAVVSMFDSMEDALVEFITTGKLNFADLVNSIAAELARLAVQMAIIRPLLGFFGISAAAQGAVYDRGHIQAFADGGVVSRPTLFPTSTGLGLMGERGPEAIMPLQRLPGGDLGVRAAGMGNVFAPSINITMNQAQGGGSLDDPAQARRIAGQIKRELQGSYAEFMRRQAQPGGGMNPGRRV